MALKTVQWTFDKKLSCACEELPVDVILCVNPDKIDQGPCPLQEAPEVTPETNFTWHTIEAILTTIKCPPNECVPPNFLYTFVYEDSFLIPDNELLAADIEGIICEGCITKWVRDKVGQDVRIERRTVEGITSVVLINQHGCEYLILEEIEDT